VKSTNTGFPPAVKAVVDARSGAVCEVCGEEWVTEYHHRRPRAMGGSRAPETNAASNALGVCWNCHKAIESHRRIAIRCGWLVPQRENPAVVAVIYRGRPVLLGEHGEITEVEHGR